MVLLTVLQTHARNKMPTSIASKFPGGKNIVGAHSFQQFSNQGKKRGPHALCLSFFSHLDL
jgi:hypothetical protein